MLASCALCSKPFTPRRKGIKQLYCTPACRIKANVQIKAGLRASSRRDRVCPICRKPVPETRKSGAVTCSIECTVTMRNRARRSTEPKDPCSVCGDPVTRRGARFCSAECRHLARPERSAEERDRLRWAFILRKYGVTKEMFKEILARQDDRCAICRTPEPGEQGWQLDHDHRINKARGILCGRCNRGLGLFGDNAESLDRAADYLRQFATKSSLDVVP